MSDDTNTSNGNSSRTAVLAQPSAPLDDRLADQPRPDAIVNLDFTAVKENRGDHWAAYIDPTGTTVYADDEAALDARVEQFISLFLSVAPDVMGYLHAHHVPHTVEYDGHQVNPLAQRYPTTVIIPGAPPVTDAA